MYASCVLCTRFFQVREADIVVCAAGRPEMVKADWIKPGAAVIDVGINSVDDPTSKKGYGICNVRSATLLSDGVEVEFSFR